MLYAVVSLVISLVLIFSEFFLPGGIMGAIGAILFIISIILSFVHGSSLYEALIFAVIALFCLLSIIRIALARMKSGKGNKHMYHQDDQEGYIACEVDKTLIGKEGTAFTDLKPSGFISVQGERFQAISQGGYLEKGTSIVVINAEGAHYRVKKLEK